MGVAPHSNGLDFTAEGFFGPSLEANTTIVPVIPPARTKQTAIPMYSVMMS